MAMPQTRVERWTVRIAVFSAFGLTVAGGILLPHTGPLPGPALGTKWVLYALRALAIFYGILLLVVPLLRAFRGDLPIELSWRGARYEEARVTSDVVEKLDGRVLHLETRSEELAELVQGALEGVHQLEIGVSPAVVPESRPRSEPH